MGPRDPGSSALLKEVESVESQSGYTSSPTNSPDKRAVSGREGEGIASQGVRAIPKRRQWSTDRGILIRWYIALQNSWEGKKRGGGKGKKKKRQRRDTRSPPTDFVYGALLSLPEFRHNNV